MTDNIETLSSGVVVVRSHEEIWLTLLLRAWHNWDFPKGVREEGEDSMQAAMREVGEETGIVQLSFDWGYRHTDTGPYSKGKTARYYLASTRQSEVEMGISPELGRPEHHEYRWVTFDEAYDLSSPRVKEVVRWARQIIGA